MPFCVGCGKEVVLGAQFCPSCGKPIPNIVPQPPTYSQPTPMYFPPTPPAPKSDRNLIIIILAIVTIVVIIGAAAAVVFLSPILSQPKISITKSQVNTPQPEYDSLGNCLGESLTFSFTLANSGSANGYAHVVLWETYKTQIWSSNYLVDHGQSLPVSTSILRTGCTTVYYFLNMTSQWKA